MRVKGTRWFIIGGDMADSSPDRRVLCTVLLNAGAAGVAVGAFALAGGSLILYESSGLVIATAGLIGSVVLALLVGLWAATPTARQANPPVRERFLVSSVAVGLGGIFATLLQVDGTLGVGTVGRVWSLLLLVAFPAYGVGMALPVLRAWGVVHLSDDAGREEEDRVTGQVVAGFLIGIAAGGVGAGYGMLAGLGPGPILILAAMLMLLPFLLHRGTETMPQETLVFRTDTPFYDLRVTEVVYPGDRQPERRLYLNGEEESGELVRSGAPTLAYIAAAETFLAQSTAVGADYLFLGGGAYTLPRRVAERDPRARITVVELDPQVTQAAYHHFGLRPEHRIHSVHGDARAFLEKRTANLVHRIYLDVYGGGEAVPYSLITLEAFQAMRAHLTPDGYVLVNLIGAGNGPESARFWSTVRTFATVFPAAALYSHLGTDFPDRQNFLLTGAIREPATPFPSQVGVFERWETSQWPDEAGTIIYRDLLTPDEPVQRPSAERLTAVRGDR